MNEKKFIKRLDEYLCCDLLNDIEMDLYMGREVTQEKAEAMNKMLSKIYRMAHSFSDCKHIDWQKETNEFIDYEYEQA